MQLLFCFRVSGQDTLKQTALPDNKVITSVAVFDFFTSFAGFNVINGEAGSKGNNVYLYYNFSLNNKLKAGKFVMLNYYFTELGMRKYMDSISCISDDQYNFKNSFSYRIFKTPLALNVSILNKSQYFNHYNFRNDTLGNSTRYLFSGYLSPGYTNFSGGLKFELLSNCSVELGLVNGRNTKIKNQKLFVSRQTRQLYGLEQGTSKKTDLGFNLILSVPTHLIAKNFYIENFSQVNVNKDKLTTLKDYMFDVNNAFHFKFLKHFRITLRTKLLYDITIGPKPGIMNSLTLGYYFNNTF